MFCLAGIYDMEDKENIFLGLELHCSFSQEISFSNQVDRENIALFRLSSTNHSTMKFIRDLIIVIKVRCPRRDVVEKILMHYLFLLSFFVFALFTSTSIYLCSYA